MVNLSIIIPTIGRTTLDACIGSFVDDLIPDDQVIIMSDDPSYNFSYWNREHGEIDWIYHVNSQRLGTYGHASRNYALDVYVENDWLWTIDDDDEAMSGALHHLRDAAESGEAPWYVFKMQFGWGHPAKGHTIWNFPGVLLGNVGTPMILAPYGESRFGTSADNIVGEGYFGDLEYAQALEAEHGQPAWREEIIAQIRP